MPIIADILPHSYVSGVRFHKPSQNYIAEIGYHKLNRIAADGSISTKRIRTTHYLGSLRRRDEAEAKYAVLKDDWLRCVAEQRKLYDQENAQRRLHALPPLPRFKPVWPNATVRRELHLPTIASAAPIPAGRPTAERFPMAASAPTTLLDLTIRAARDRYVTHLRKRIGLQNGKGINKNTFEKSVQSLNLSSPW